MTLTFNPTFPPRPTLDMNRQNTKSSNVQQLPGVAFGREVKSREELHSRLEAAANSSAVENTMKPNLASQVETLKWDWEGAGGDGSRLPDLRLLSPEVQAELEAAGELVSQAGRASGHLHPSEVEKAWRYYNEIVAIAWQDAENRKQAGIAAAPHNALSPAGLEARMARDSQQQVYGQQLNKPAPTPVTITPQQIIAEKQASHPVQQPQPAKQADTSLSDLLASVQAVEVKAQDEPFEEPGYAASEALGFETPAPVTPTFAVAVADADGEVVGSPETIEGEVKLVQGQNDEEYVAFETTDSVAGTLGALCEALVLRPDLRSFVVSGDSTWQIGTNAVVKETTPGIKAVFLPIVAT